MTSLPNFPIMMFLNYFFLPNAKKRALSGASGGSHGAESRRAKATGRDAGGKPSPHRLTPFNFRKPH